MEYQQEVASTIMVRKHRYVNKSIIHSIHFYLGSGTVGNLVLALNLARLFQTSSLSYSTYQYRVRFCWWGAEELGLIGARHHVALASLPNATIVGERVQDYLVNLNYDMLAGPNYYFGIHNGLSVPPTTPPQALNGTNRITELFRQWFNEQNLPWSNASLLGGSDYVPFLAAGVAVGGVNTGAGGIKSAAIRDQYSAVLGTGNGGLANAAFDPCYHQQCDRITNINPFAYEKVVKAAAYAIEYLGRLNDLEKWLYPQGRLTNFTLLNRNQLYDFHNDPDLI
jgi:Zn-dependent M28 family amino/carboxypeptidase